jgi:hypothetical protein
MITDRLVLVGVAALSAVATAGWMRQIPVAPQASNFTAPMLQPDGSIQAQSAAFAPPVSGAYSGEYPQAYRGVRSSRQPAPISARTVSDGYDNRTRPVARVYDDRRVDDERQVVKERSTTKSIAIVAGGAAAGAAIGGLAGGGKGAAIGALGGGAAGYIYDRMTKNK